MSATSPVWGRYTELNAETLEAIREQIPVAYLPWGALEWHGPHLPLGTDGFVAEAVAEEVLRRTGGVLFPTTWWPGARFPTEQTLAVRSSVLYEMWSDMFDWLASAGWRVVVIVSGHYRRDHELTMMEAAEEAINQHNLLVLALPPLVLIDESLLDHAGLWETSLLLSLRPDLVNLYALGDEDLLPASTGVQGRDPRGAASASLGDTVMHITIERVSKAVSELVTSGDPAPLHVLYEQRRERYRAQEGEKS
jgi:creatinine amidohydrolase